MKRIYVAAFAVVVLLVGIGIMVTTDARSRQTPSGFLNFPGGSGFPGNPHPKPTYDTPPDSELDILARKPYRPTWGPLPMFRGEEMAQRFLPALLKASKPSDRARAAFLLGQIGNREWSNAVAALLKDDSREVRTHASIALACLGDPRGLSGSAEALSTTVPWVQYYAVWGLWNINTKAARTAIRTAVPHLPKWVSQVARQALGTRFVRPPVVPALKAINVKLPKVSPSEIWQQAESILVPETDWWFHNGQWDSSIRCRYACNFLDPSNPDNYAVIAYIDWSEGRTRQADRVLMQGVANVPKNPVVYYNLGTHYILTKRFIMAERPLKRSVELNGNHLARRTYAHCLEKLGKQKLALQQWEALLKTMPKDGGTISNCKRLRKIMEKK